VLLGKYLNDYPKTAAATYVPPGWDEWYSPAAGNPYLHFNYTLNENDRLATYADKPEDYLTDVLARKAVDFLHRAKGSSRPFFMYMSTFAPHPPAVPAPRHSAGFADLTVPRSPSFNEDDTRDKPRWIRVRPRISRKVVAQFDEHYRRRIRSLQAVDEMVGELVHTLEVTGALRSTVIVFTSDNGFHMGEHRLPKGKTTAYDEDIRVPFFMRGPGIPEKQTVTAFGLNNDLAPTFAELAGATPPAFVDGRSLVRWFNGRAVATLPWRDGFLIEHYASVSHASYIRRLIHQVRRPDQPSYAALRTRDHLFVEYVNGEHELYDLARDGFQLSNQFAGADRALLKALVATLQSLKKCASVSCHTAEDAQGH
jgi:arylsulfatase A-like enzyme